MILYQKKRVEGLNWSIAQVADKWLLPYSLGDPGKFLQKYFLQQALKEFPTRKAFTISGPRGNLYLKRYKIRGLGEVLNYFFALSKVQRES